jgi:hypothetical protein
MAFHEAPPREAFAVDGIDIIFESLVREPLKGTQTTYLEDMKIVEWMIYTLVFANFSGLAARQHGVRGHQGGEAVRPARIAPSMVPSRSSAPTKSQSSGS